jgi:TolB-like protein
MKAIKNILLGIGLSACLFQTAMAQTSTRPKIAILNIDTKNHSFSPRMLGNILRTEVEKLDSFEVIDRYDAEFVLKQKSMKMDSCYGKLCALEIAQQLGAEKAITGNIESYGQNLSLTLRLIDVATRKIERTQVNDYLYLQDEINDMLRLSMLQLFNRSFNKDLLSSISKKNNYENTINNNNKVSVILNGPRTGFTYFFGETADIIASPRDKGGYNAYPIMFQFGYQYEKQYLNEGNYQALVEFFPTITGFNQNMFIPSLTIMNGFRENKYGWEIAFGPTISLVNKATGYYDTEGQWRLEKDWKDSTAIPFPVLQRVDSRGIPEINAGFVIAVGKTIKSGRLNIPVNIYFVPNKDGARVGLSFGFNAKKS